MAEALTVPRVAAPAPSLGARLGAEALGTFVLVLGGCGAAVLAAATPEPGIGPLGIALAFGLTVLVMACAVGHVSGGHFNPAVTVGLAVAGRFPRRDVVAYVVAQVAAAILAALVLFLIASGQPGFSATDSGFATNGFGDRSPGGFSLGAALLTEVVLTAVFLYVILGATDDRSSSGPAGIPIGLALTMLILVGLPVTGASLNPARSTGPAFFAGGEALGQLWLFWLAPLVGAVLAGATYAVITGDRTRASVTGSADATGDPTRERG